MRALIAENDDDLRGALEKRLGLAGFDTLAVGDGEQAWLQLSVAEGPRLAILEWDMPAMGGLEVCRRVREQALEPYVYLLLLAGDRGKEHLLSGLVAGADDCLHKPCDMQELLLRLEIGRRIVSLQNGLVRARDSYRVQANHDALTGLSSRGALMDALELEHARSQREKRDLSVILADIDHFKVINDSLGHPAGDAVLREVARRLRTELRPYDVLGRYGGEELLAVLPGCNVGEAVLVAERLRRAIADVPVVHQGQSIQVTASFGVAEDTGKDGLTLVFDADRALYAAKRGGRDRVSSDCPSSQRESLIVPHRNVSAFTDASTAVMGDSLLVGGVRVRV